MNSFERLLEHTDAEHIRVLEKQFKSNAKGLIKGNKIARGLGTKSAIIKGIIFD